MWVQVVLPETEESAPDVQQLLLMLSGMIDSLANVSRLSREPGCLGNLNGFNNDNPSCLREPSVAKPQTCLQV